MLIAAEPALLGATGLLILSLDLGVSNPFNWVAGQGPEDSKKEASLAPILMDLKMSNESIDGEYWSV